MTPEERTRVATSLAAAFKQHLMKDHLEELRRYWRKAPGCWNDDFVQHWAALLRLPGYENVLEVRPSGSLCRGCDTAVLRTGCNFPGGWTVWCDGCQREWIVLERAKN